MSLKDLIEAYNEKMEALNQFKEEKIEEVNKLIDEKMKIIDQIATAEESVKKTLNRKLEQLNSKIESKKKIIEDYYNKGLLDIAAPEDIMDSFSRKMAKIAEDITVTEFEQKENALIRMVFDGEKMIFPADDLNIKGMCVTYDAKE